MMIKLHVMTQLYLGAPSPMKRMDLNDNDLHPSVSSEPLIKDEKPNLTPMRNLAYKYKCSLTM